GDPSIDDEKDFPDRFALIVRVTQDLITFDPVSAYLTLMQELKKEKNRIDGLGHAGKPVPQIYYKNLLFIKDEFEKAKLIQLVRNYLSQLTRIPEVNQLYKAFFEASLKPSFIGSSLLVEEEEKLELLDEYMVKGATIQIFEHPNELARLYYVNAPEYSFSPEKYFIWNKATEIVSKMAVEKASLATISKSRKFFERTYESLIASIAQENNIRLGQDEVVELAEIVARYTVGYGILEILLSDRKEFRDTHEEAIGSSEEDKELFAKMKKKGVITDIYLDAPIGQKPIYLVHSQFGDCKTNILFSDNDAEKIISKIRAQSGRPFDESHPVLDYDVPEFEARVAIIGPPLSPDGKAFAFR
ncbi:MAG: hypothetical protein Q7K42_00500, partial [Candidatus Diapherotrites archaeon]|nr:hypothetical protein [Candidatus Diapherotrites archaeon]